MATAAVSIFHFVQQHSIPQTVVSNRMFTLQKNTKKRQQTGAAATTDAIFNCANSQKPLLRLHCILSAIAFTAAKNKIHDKSGNNCYQRIWKSVIHKTYMPYLQGIQKKPPAKAEGCK